VSVAGCHPDTATWLKSFPWVDGSAAAACSRGRLDGRVITVLPVFAPGAVIVVEERWRGLPWSAEPHCVVARSAVP